MYLPRGKILSRLYSRPRITYRGINIEVLACGKLYGRLADVLKTGKSYKLPAHHMEKDYLPELQPGEPALSQSQKDKLFERAYQRYYAKVDKVSDQKPNMYFTLAPCLDWHRIKDNTIIATCIYHFGCKQNGDSDVLAIIISKTH
jgi:hypothetical protein